MRWVWWRFYRWIRKGIVLAIGDPQDLQASFHLRDWRNDICDDSQVLYNQTTLSSDLHDSFIPGVAGQASSVGKVCTDVHGSSLAKHIRARMSRFS